MRALIIGAGLLALGACAATGPSRYSEDMAALEAECRERGGVLAPNPQGFGTTGNPAVENFCKVRSTPSDRFPRTD